jgi:spore germination cell wall hydrolase CwlJ-like protein
MIPSLTTSKSDFISKLLTIVLTSVGVFCSLMLLDWALDYQAKRANEQRSSIVAAQRERELTCLARNIYYEAGNEPFEGKVAVAQVTLNRVEHDDFPMDICQVVYQKNIFYSRTVCQFSWFCDQRALLRPIDKKTYDESMIVAKKVLLEGFRLPSLHQALYYHADYISPRWKKPRILKIGRHIFYAEPVKR